MKLSWPDIKLINYLRKFFGQYILEREWRTVKRDVRSVNMNSAKNVGIMFNARDKKQFGVIKAFVTELRSDGKKVKALGFVPKKELIELLETDEDYGFFGSDDFNWYFKPKGRKVVGFMSEPFDLLIDLRLKKSIPLLFIVSLSRATFKVGRFREEFKEFYDLMIEMEDENELDNFISQVKHYLNMITEK